MRRAGRDAGPDSLSDRGQGVPYAAASGVVLQWALKAYSELAWVFETAERRSAELFALIP